MCCCFHFLIQLYLIFSLWGFNFINGFQNCVFLLQSMHFFNTCVSNFFNQSKISLPYHCRPFSKLNSYWLCFCYSVTSNFCPSGILHVKPWFELLQSCWLLKCSSVALLLPNAGHRCFFLAETVHFRIFLVNIEHQNRGTPHTWNTANAHTGTGMLLLLCC